MDLESYISFNPSDFDNTSIGTQLREFGAHLDLYLEIQGLWSRLQEVRKGKRRLEALLKEISSRVEEEL